MVKIKREEEIGEILRSYWETHFPDPRHNKSSGMVKHYDFETWSRIKISFERLILSAQTLSARELSESTLISIIRDKIQTSHEHAIRELPPVHIAQLLVAESLGN